MRNAAGFVDETQLAAVIGRHWRLRVDAMRYLPEGGGAYHWVASTAEGDRVLVTCDDLATKPWLGHDCDTVFSGLLATYGFARRLRTECGMAFVCAPLPSIGGDVVVRLDGSHSVAVLPFIDGSPGTWGRALDQVHRRELLHLLASLHSSALDLAAVPTPGFTIGNRAALEDALGDLDRRWDQGPMSDQARRVISDHAALLHEWLDRLDSYRPESGSDHVLTHGEPHPGNLMVTAHGLVLLDWDTLGVALPERDLWMLGDADSETLVAYSQLTGRRLDPRALAAYRLLWALSDVAAFAADLRRPHERTADAVRALAGIRSILAGVEPAPWG